ncbi:MAG TPA: hypothetical protein VGS06_25480 [Streptosporangiaceae bacterium]|nr:hypothetical protein [Streptosporangiaceae bacterium]
MNQVVTTLTAGGEPDTPLDDSILRLFVFAHGDRVTWMARATGGPPPRPARPSRRSSSPATTGTACTAVSASRTSRAPRP